MLANELIVKKTISQRTMEYSDLRISSDGVENFTLKKLTSLITLNYYIFLYSRPTNTKAQSWTPLITAHIATAIISRYQVYIILHSVHIKFKTS